MDEKAINAYLLRWGKNPQGKSIMRLVWSDSLREFRRGTFNEFYGSIFVRTAIGVQEVPKYSYIQAKWVLERWFPSHNPELPESYFSGTYEPVYVFQDKFGHALPLNQQAVELICHFLFEQRPLTLTEMCAFHVERDELADQKEQDYLEDSLEMSVISNQLHQKEAIVRP